AFDLQAADLRGPGRLRHRDQRHRSGGQLAFRPPCGVPPSGISWGEIRMRTRHFLIAMIALLTGAIAAGIGFAAPYAPQLFAQRSGTTVDVELVLAVDVSYSMDPEEQELQ